MVAATKPYRQASARASESAPNRSPASWVNGDADAPAPSSVRKAPKPASEPPAAERGGGLRGGQPALGRPVLPYGQPAGQAEDQDQGRSHHGQGRGSGAGGARRQQGEPADGHPGDQREVDRNRRQVGDDPQLGPGHGITLACDNKDCQRQSELSSWRSGAAAVESGIRAVRRADGAPRAARRAGTAPRITPT